MIPSKEDMQLQSAMWALKRIVRKQAGFRHKKETPTSETCDCPQCIAKDALEQIQDYEKRFLEMGLTK